MRNTHQVSGAARTVRFSVSMEAELLARFEALLRKTGWSRSKAIRALVRNQLAQSQLATGHGPAVGVLAYLYRHDQPGLVRRLMHVQHESQAAVVSSTHVHLDRHDCLEVLILHGSADRLRRLADQVLALRGVRQGHLTLTPARCPLARKYHH